MKHRQLNFPIRWWVNVTLGTVVGLTSSGISSRAAEPAAASYAKDVAPIFREKCESCHRPGSVAPMSLTTYEEARPWVRSIKARVERREMPPWHIDTTIGIQKFKNDRSLTDEQIATIVRWVDTGAPMGDPKDLPPSAQWPADDVWTIGKPDIIVTSPVHMLYAKGPDWWGNLDADPGLTEDRYIQAVETKPAKRSRRVVHHAGTSVVGLEGEAGFLSEYAVGKYGDIYPNGTGKLLKAGSKIRFNVHLHPYGEEVPVEIMVGYKLYPKGYVPTHVVSNINVGTQNGKLYQDLDIPPNTVTRHDAYFRLEKAARIISYQPHMHIRGKAMTLEAIYPNGQVRTLSRVDRFDFNWHVAYVYADDVAPLLPAGTVLHTIGIHDNTAAHRGNPDPNQWVGFGQRSFDDMLQCHILAIYLDEDEFRRQAEERGTQQQRMAQHQQ